MKKKEIKINLTTAPIGIGAYLSISQPRKPKNLWEKFLSLFGKKFIEREYVKVTDRNSATLFVESI